MIRSMTAFASGERATAWGTLACELRSVNHRFLEVGVRLHDELRSLEPVLRERVAARITRGKLDLTLRLRTPEGTSVLQVDPTRVRELSDLAIDGSTVFPLSIFSLSRPAITDPDFQPVFPLDRYVEAPDSSYRYEVAATIPGNGYTASVLDMTSQTWRAPGEVDRTVWMHWLIVIRPAEVRHRTAFLYISGGNNNSAAPKTADENLVRVATITKSMVAELRMVPNQPLVFADDKQPRTEDAIIAYTWDKYLRTGDDQWPLRLPMTKAAVRAMDTVVSHCAGDNVPVDGFVVAGGSTRGWTAWTTLFRASPNRSLQMSLVR